MRWTTTTRRRVFTSSHKSLLLSYFCVPHTVGGNAEEILARVSGGERALLWPRSEARRAPLPELRWGEIPLFADVWGDEQAADELGAGWEAGEALADAAGARVASVWRNGQGSVFLPFDPDAAITAYWSEAYKQPGRSRLAMRGVLRRPAGAARARCRSGSDARSVGSRRGCASHAGPWRRRSTTSTSWLFGLLGEVAGRPVPRLAPWPDGTFVGARAHARRRDSRPGYDDVRPAARPRARAGGTARRGTSSRAATTSRTPSSMSSGPTASRSACTASTTTGATSSRGPASRSGCPRCATWAERWRAVGFRSPATHRALGADAAARLRLRLVVSRHRSVRAAVRRLLLAGSRSRSTGSWSSR